MSACDRCHRRKSRCDKQHPCTNCQKANIDCSYTDRTRASTRADVEALQNRLRELESKNKENELRLYEQTPIELKTRANEKSRQGSLPAARHSPEVPISSFSSHEEVDRGIPVPITHLSPMISSTPVAPLSDVMSEVSFLASNAAGERQFLGSTSGVLFANLVRTSVNVSEPEETISSKRRRVSENGIQPQRASYKNTLVAAETLPPENLARKLVDSYIFHDHIAYPFLLPSYILSISEAIYKDPKFYVNNIFEAFVFDMVLAIANANVYKYDWQMLPSAEVHHSRAMVHLTEVFQSGGLKSLQAILLLCQYRTGSSIQDTSASMWHLVGIAVRTAFELGLHRESGYLLKSNDNVSIEAFREQEVRRRCFWCVFAMDRVVSITLGRPLAINIDDVDVELPKSDNDGQFNVGIPGQESLQRTSTFVHIVQYRILCGKVMRGLHGLKRPNHDESAIYRLRDSLADELTRWWQNTECLELIETGTSSPLPQQRSCFRSKEWYEILYQNAVLMLFRPSPMLSDISKEPATLQKIFGSSKQAILLYASLHRSRKINYSWITLHSVFMAGLSYIYAVSCHFREQRRPSPTGVMLSSDPKPMELVNDTRACSNVLVAVSERWNALRHCHEVFDRLSDAVLEDAIKLHTTPKRDQQSLQSAQPSTYYGNNLDRSTQSHISSSFMSNATQSNNWIGSSSAIVSQSNNYAQPSPLAVDAEFRNCFGDLQNLYHEQYNDDPVIQLSQDWLGYLNDYNGILPG